ncbi:hypothetical protein GA0116948_104234 [Chitinophaga costaii]|uniref:Peptidase S74 domain-containing protein n=1 Tax=Chitinophaga costaii TaxID=1335309 RepID=A0A1C4CPQ7_9BACT|nr:hypothetical protein [Chitinophaga costaii]PUZ27005.1 hypothetical protein DCM91_07130 [Chitinophaga costaii]SCC21095.1 hypothetical protein GA0116948_104234 [Chitinophaga costaii]
MNRFLTYVLLGFIGCLMTAIQVFGQTTTAGSYFVNNRYYYVDRGISGSTRDATGIDYILLHEAYNGTLLAEHYIMGKITGIRGATTGWNRKVTIEVNTASAYNTDRGSVVSYNEPTFLAYVTYNAKKYLALAINNGSIISSFSFTGYAYNEMLTLVSGADVTSPLPFLAADPVAFQGNVGIGTLGPAAKLYVKANNTGSDINATANLSGDVIVEAPTGGRLANKGASLEFALPANTDGSNPYGQGRILTVAGNTANGQAVGKMILGTRRQFTKTGDTTSWSYGDDLVIDGSGNVGIGTLTPQSLLSVKGLITAQKVKVTMTGWADYVFENGYQLPSLQWLEAYVKAHHHLPDLPAGDTVTTQGLDVGEMNKLLLKKLEEQTLYLIELNKKVDALQLENKQLKTEMGDIKKQIIEN